MGVGVVYLAHDDLVPSAQLSWDRTTGTRRALGSGVVVGVVVLECKSDQSLIV